MAKMAKIRTGQLVNENSFLAVIFIVDHESDLGNFIIYGSYYKNDPKRQNEISTIPTSGRAENLQAWIFEPCDLKSHTNNNIFFNSNAVEKLEKTKYEKKNISCF